MKTRPSGIFFQRVVVVRALSVQLDFLVEKLTWRVLLLRFNEGAVEDLSSPAVVRV